MRRTSIKAANSVSVEPIVSFGTPFSNERLITNGGDNESISQQSNSLIGVRGLKSYSLTPDRPQRCLARFFAHMNPSEHKFISMCRLASVLRSSAGKNIEHSGAVSRILYLLTTYFVDFYR
jgi:hypothetical protein